MVLWLWNSVFSPLCHLPAVANRTTDQANIVGDPTAAAANDLGQQTGVENVAAASGMVNPVSASSCCWVRAPFSIAQCSSMLFSIVDIKMNKVLVQNSTIWSVEVTK